MPAQALRTNSYGPVPTLATPIKRKTHPPHKWRYRTHSNHLDHMQGHHGKTTNRERYIGDSYNELLILSSITMDKDDNGVPELQLMPPVISHSPRGSQTRPSRGTDHQPLDLSLSISIGPQRSATLEEIRPPPPYEGSTHSLKQQTAEQIRLAAVERAYAERIRELTRRELETAEKEFARARMVWERARQEVERVERMKEIATRRINSSCLEITCQACRQRFRPL